MKPISIYAFKLSNDKYYIGKTTSDDISSKFQEHFDGTLGNWHSEPAFN